MDSGWMQSRIYRPKQPTQSSFASRKILPITDPNFSSIVSETRSRLARVMAVSPSEIFFVDLRMYMDMLKGLANVANCLNQAARGRERFTLQTVRHVNDKGHVLNVANLSKRPNVDITCAENTVIVDGIGTLGQLPPKLLEVGKLGCDGYVISPFEGVTIPICAVYLRRQFLRKLFEKVGCSMDYGRGQDKKSLIIDLDGEGVGIKNLLHLLMSPEASRMADEYSTRFADDVVAYSCDMVLQAGIPALNDYLAMLEKQQFDNIYQKLLKAFEIIRTGLYSMESVELFWHPEIVSSPGILSFRIKNAKSERMKSLADDLREFGISCTYIESENFIQIKLSMFDDEKSAITKLKIIEEAIKIQTNL